MKRNPVNIFHDRALKAAQIIEISMRIAIHTKRAKKFNTIDLRHYKSNPKKKDRIRKIATLNYLIVFHLMTNMRTISFQPIQTYNFDKGGVIAE